MLETIKPFAIALLIGLIIGIEREHSHPEGSQAFGVRTFILLALMGTLAAYLHQPMLDIVISIFVFVLIVAGYLRTTGKNIKRQEPNSGMGLTTEFSAGSVYCLGYIAFQQGFLAIVIAVFVLLVLVTRQRLRAFSRRQIKSEEIQAASILLAIGLGLLPFLPDRSIDPWHLFNPHLFGMLFLAIASIQFGGYIAVRLMGEKLGLVLTGFFGGLVSSTAVFMNIPKLMREEPDLWYHGISASLLAFIASLMQFLVILSFVSQILFEQLCWPVIAMMVTGILLSVIFIRDKLSHPALLHPLNPLDLKSAIRFSFILAGMIFLVGLTRKYLGLNAFKTLNFLGGLFETHSVTFATANLYANHQLAFANAQQSLGLVVLASVTSKIILLAISGRNRYGLLTTGCMLLMILAGSIVYYLIN